MKTNLLKNLILTMAAGLVWANTIPAALAVPCTTVTSTADDGSAGTLRAALACATNGATIDATGISGTITLTNGELLVTTSVTILGPGANVLAINGNAASGVFEISSNLTVTIAGLTITNGAGVYEATISATIGGGILNNSSTLTVSNCTVSGNLASQGGGIFNNGEGGAAMLTVLNCTISGNSAGYAGGGIYNDGESGSAALTVVNSTLSGNSADTAGGIYNDGFNGSATLNIFNSTLSGNSTSDGGGGGIFNDGSFAGSAALTVVNSTLSGNSALGGNAGGGIFNTGYHGSATLTVLNSTLSGNSAPDGGEGGGIYNDGYNGSATVTLGSAILDAGSGLGGTIVSFAGVVASLGYNLSSDNGGGFLTATSDITSTTPLLGPLQDNGGPTFTQAPLCGSPAIGAGTNFSGLPTDQRGFPRPLTGPVDIGAVQTPVQMFMVTNTNDDGSAGSLRWAITNANANPGPDTIVFAANVTNTITLTNGELLITDCLTILGPGANVLAISGNAASRVFEISPGITVTIAGLTITNGNGGGILNNGSTLTVSNCTISGNSASQGGGIFNNGEGGAAMLTVLNSTLSGNSASQGGGIYNYADGGSAMLTVLNSTLSGNSASQGGGGIDNDGGAVTVFNSTLSGNSTSDGGGGGIFNQDGTLTLGSTILDAGSGSGGTIDNNGGTVTSDGYNLSSDNGGGFLTATSDITNTPSLLGPLQDNGGPTPTMALLCGSPAIDAGTNFSGSAYDQRGPGYPRTVGAAIVAGGDGTDIGAFEVQTLNCSPVTAPCMAIIATNEVAIAPVTLSASGGEGGPYTFTATGLPAGLTISPSGTISGTPTVIGTNSYTLIVTDAVGNMGTNSSCMVIVVVANSVATPAINTSQQPATATVGCSIADQATVSGGNNPTGTVTFNLYNNPAASGTPLFTDTNEPLSNGVATSECYIATAAGTDYWVAAYSGDPNNNPVSSGAASEPVTIKPASPAIETRPQPIVATVGTSIADRARVRGGFNPTGTVTFKLYGDWRCAHEPLFTDTEMLSGRTATSAGYIATATGVDFWVATYNGDSNNNPAAGRAYREPVRITPARPTITTSQQPASATVGSSIADQATVSGGYNPAGTVTFKLYGDWRCAHEPLFTDTETLVSGVAASKGYIARTIGTDYWVATYNGDSNNVPVSSRAYREPVNITRAQPTIATSQQPAVATVGSSIADQATVSGGYNPAGTVTFKLYSNATASGMPLFTDTRTLVSGLAASKGYTARNTGTDYWVAAYNGDANNNPVSSGAASEPVVISSSSPALR